MYCSFSRKEIEFRSVTFYFVDGFPCCDHLFPSIVAGIVPFASVLDIQYSIDVRRGYNIVLVSVCMTSWKTWLYNRANRDKRNDRSKRLGWYYNWKRHCLCPSTLPNGEYVQPLMVCTQCVCSSWNLTLLKFFVVFIKAVLQHSFFFFFFFCDGMSAGDFVKITKLHPRKSIVTVLVNQLITEMWQAVKTIVAREVVEKAIEEISLSL